MTDLEKIELSIRRLADELGAPSWLRRLADQIVKDEAERQRSFQHISVCKLCHGKFESGPRARRAGSKFCCDEHRIQFNSLARSQYTSTPPKK